MSIEYVTLVNRIGEPLEGVWDSRVHVIKPGKQEMLKPQAIKFVEQHPIMGSEDARTGEMIYKLAIEEFNMDTSPLTKEFLAQFEGARERWNRKNAPELEQNVKFAQARPLAGEGRSNQSAGTEFKG